VKVTDRYRSAAEFNNALGNVKDLAADITPVAAHAGHNECWEVIRRSDGHAHTVCVAAAAGGSREVVARHSTSGHRVNELCRTVRNRHAELVALRRAFDELTRLRGSSGRRHAS
jgi:hypothetical protein